MNLFGNQKAGPITYLLAWGLMWSGISSSTNAEEEEAERIYQIEIIVFERTAKTASEDPESWPKNVSLEYPNNREKLIDPSKPLTKAATREDANNPMGLSKEFLQALSNKEGTVNNAPPSVPEQALAPEADPEANPDGIKQLVFLDNSKKMLNEQQKALDKTRGIRTIFHQTWIQSLSSPQTAPALMIQGGNQYGSHYELEGTITLGVSRYLHIKTNLWLTSFVPNYGQPSEHWPDLPSQERQYFWSDFNNAQAHDVKPDTSISLNFATYEDNGLNTDYGSNNNISTSQAKADSQYLIKEIVVLTQSRKMRSKELHYLDHPRMGLLVKIIPYSPPITNKDK